MKIHEITEGIHDPHIFKAILTAGGPGSGKSTVVQNIIGGTGLKNVNSDIFYEFFAKMQNLNLKGLTGTEKSKELRDLAHIYKNKALIQFIQGRLGMIIDGSGRNFNRIIDSVELLKSLGYDVMMLFVNTDIDAAMQRNLNRERVVPTDYFYTAHKQAQTNLHKYKQYFGDDLVIVDNSDDTHTDFSKVNKKIMRFINKPVSNTIAKEWMNNQTKGE